MEIRFSNCGVSFGARTALSPFSLTLNERRIGIIGLNGSGKTTFAKLINGLVKPTVGSVTVNGHDTDKDAKAVLAQAGFIFQNPAQQIIMPIVQEDVAYGVRARGVSKAEANIKALATLDSLGITDLAKRRVHELSGGENQLVAIASVIATEPSILILDEPVNQLDLKNRKRVVDTLARLEQNLIVISHDLALLEDYDRVILFDQGQIVADGAPADVIARYRELAEC